MLHEALTAPSTVAAATDMSSGRFGPTLTAVLGLAAAVLGARAFTRARHPGSPPKFAGPDRPPTATLLGVVAMLLGGLFLATADGGPGTGNGVVGSIAAIVLGSVGIALDRLGSKQQTHRSSLSAPVEPDR